MMTSMEEDLRYRSSVLEAAERTRTVRSYEQRKQNAVVLSDSELEALRSEFASKVDQALWLHLPLERYVNDPAKKHIRWMDLIQRGDRGVINEAILDLFLPATTVRANGQHSPFTTPTGWRPVSTRGPIGLADLKPLVLDVATRENAGVYALLGYQKENPLLISKQDPRNLRLLKIVEVYVGTAMSGGVREQYFLKQGDSVTMSLPHSPLESGPRVHMWYRVSAPLSDVRSNALRRLNKNLAKIEADLHGSEDQDKTRALSSRYASRYLTMILLGYNPVLSANDSAVNQRRVEWSEDDTRRTKGSGWVPYESWDTVYERVYETANLLAKTLPWLAPNVQNLNRLALMDLLSQLTDKQEVESFSTDSSEFLTVSRLDVSSKNQAVYICVQIDGGVDQEINAVGTVSLIDETDTLIATIGSESSRVAAVFEIHVLPGSEPMLNNLGDSAVSWRFQKQKIDRSIAIMHPLINSRIYSILAERTFAPQEPWPVGGESDDDDESKQRKQQTSTHNYKKSIGNRYIQVQAHEVRAYDDGAETKTEDGIFSVRFPAFAPIASAYGSDRAKTQWAVVPLPSLDDSSLGYNDDMTDGVAADYVDTMLAMLNQSNRSGLSPFELPGASFEAPLAGSSSLAVDVHIEQIARSRSKRGPGYTYLLLFAHQNVPAPVLPAGKIAFDYVPYPQQTSLYVDENSPVTGRLRVLNAVLFVRIRWMSVKSDLEEALKERQRVEVESISSRLADASLYENPDDEAIRPVMLTVQPTRKQSDGNYRITKLSFLEEMRSNVSPYVPVLRRVYENRIRAAYFVHKTMQEKSFENVDALIADICSLSTNKELAERYQLYRMNGSSDAIWIRKSRDTLPASVSDWDNALEIDDMVPIWPEFYMEGVRLFREPFSARPLAEDSPGLEARGLRWLLNQYRNYSASFIGNGSQSLALEDVLKAPFGTREAQNFLLNAQNVLVASRVFGYVKSNPQEIVAGRAITTSTGTTVRPTQTLQEFLSTDSVLLNSIATGTEEDPLSTPLHEIANRLVLLGESDPARILVGKEIIALLQKYRSIREAIKIGRAALLSGTSDVDLDQGISPAFYELTGSLVRLQKVTAKEGITYPSLVVTKPSSDSTRLSVVNREDVRDYTMSVELLIAQLTEQPQWIEAIIARSSLGLENGERPRYYDELSVQYDQALGYGKRLAQLALVNAPGKRQTFVFYFEDTLARRSFDGKALQKQLIQKYDQLKAGVSTLQAAPELKASWILEGLAPAAAFENDQLVKRAAEDAEQRAEQQRLAYQRAKEQREQQQIAMAKLGGAGSSNRQIPAWLKDSAVEGLTEKEQFTLADDFLGTQITGPISTLGGGYWKTQVARQLDLIRWVTENGSSSPSNSSVDMETLGSIARLIELAHIVSLAPNVNALQEELRTFKPSAPEYVATIQATLFWLFNNVALVRDTEARKKLDSDKDAVWSTLDEVAIEAPLALKRNKGVASQTELASYESTFMSVAKAIASLKSDLDRVLREEERIAAIPSQVEEIFQTANLPIQRIKAINETVRALVEQFKTARALLETKQAERLVKVEEHLTNLKRSMGGMPMASDAVRRIRLDGYVRRLQSLKALISRQIQKTLSAIASRIAQVIMDVDNDKSTPVRIDQLKADTTREINERTEEKQIINWIWSPDTSLELMLENLRGVKYNVGNAAPNDTVTLESQRLDDLNTAANASIAVLPETSDTARQQLSQAFSVELSRAREILATRKGSVGVPGAYEASYNDSLNRLYRVYNSIQFAADRNRLQSVSPNVSNVAIDSTANVQASSIRKVTNRLFGMK